MVIEVTQLQRGVMKYGAEIHGASVRTESGSGTTVSVQDGAKAATGPLGPQLISEISSWGTETCLKLLSISQKIHQRQTQGE